MLNPIASANWNYDAAAHLALRASFGEPPAELEKWVNQGLDSTLEHLLRTPPPRRALQKLCQCIFQTNPRPEFLEKFIQIANSKPHPLDDRAIRDLAILMMSTPNYQLC
jgi:hypothetical protein